MKLISYLVVFLMTFPAFAEQNYPCNSELTIMSEAFMRHMESIALSEPRVPNPSDSLSSVISGDCEVQLLSASGEVTLKKICIAIFD